MYSANWVQLVTDLLAKQGEEEMQTATGALTLENKRRRRRRRRRKRQRDKLMLRTTDGLRDGRLDELFLPNRPAWCYMLYTWHLDMSGWQHGPGFGIGSVPTCQVSETYRLMWPPAGRVIVQLNQVVLF
jgi:hypothetical protein